MSNGDLDRIKYLTYKAQKGMISPSERDELAQLLGRNPSEFQGPSGLDVLIGVALAAIFIGLLAGLLSSIGKK